MKSIISVFCLISLFVSCKQQQSKKNEKVETNKITYELVGERRVLFDTIDKKRLLNI